MRYVDFDDGDQEIRLEFKDFIEFEKRSGTSFNKFLTAMQLHEPKIDEMMLFVALAAKVTPAKVQKQCEALKGQGFQWLVVTANECIVAALEGQPEVGKPEGKAKEASTPTGTMDSVSEG